MANIDRVQYFGPFDMVAGHMLEKALAKLEGLDCSTEQKNVNDIIELRQCSLCIDECLAYATYQEEEKDRYRQLAKGANALACKEFREEIITRGIESMHDDLVIEYSDAFWELFFSSGCAAEVRQDDLASFLASYPACAFELLQYKSAKQHYEAILRSVLLDNPSWTAKAIIDAEEVEGKRDRYRYLPLFTHDEFNHMIAAYIDAIDAHPDYLHFISDAKKIGPYNLSANNRLAAKHREAELNDQYFSGHSGFIFSAEIAFDPNQKACKKMVSDARNTQYTYSLQWLLKYQDCPTILNNFIYVFDFLSPTGLISAAVNNIERSAVLNAIGVRLRRAYRKSMTFGIEESRCIAIVEGYNEILSKNGLSIEDALCWYYGEYIEQEYSLPPILLDIQNNGISYYTRCKALSTELEKVCKTYSHYARHLAVDHELLDLEFFEGFDAIGSILQNKYAVACGENYHRACYLLLSDQSPLAYDKASKELHSSLLERMVMGRISKQIFDDWHTDDINWLVENGFLEVDKGFLQITSKALIYAQCFENRALPYYRFGKTIRSDIDMLVDEGEFRFDSKLLSSDESDYLSYYYNDKFTNALALRNKYAHPSSPIDDDESHFDYDRLLMLAILITLKIDDELRLFHGKTGQLEIVEWPYVELDAGTIEAILGIKANGAAEGDDDSCMLAN